MGCNGTKWRGNKDFSRHVGCVRCIAFRVSIRYSGFYIMLQLFFHLLYVRDPHPGPYFFPLHLSASWSYINVIEIPPKAPRIFCRKQGTSSDSFPCIFCNTICAIAIDPIISISIQEARLLRCISVLLRMALNPFT